jgi:ketosteroid isomerase-like protein
MSQAHISHKDILSQANAAVERDDHAGFLEHCTEDTVWTFLGDRTLRGKAAVRQWMDESYKVAPPQL